MRSLFLCLTLAVLLLGRNAHAAAPPTVLVVTNNTDNNDGACTLADCSLREAVIAANTDPDVNLIVFDNLAFATPKTVAIGSDFPAVTTSLLLVGSAAGVTIDSAAKQSGFQVAGGTVTLLNLTLTGDGNNFGVQNSAPGANLTVQGCTFSGNFNALQLVAGATQVQNSTFAGNTRGILSTTDFTLGNSTISGNFTGLYLNGATVTPTVSNTIIVSNNTPVSNNNGSSVTDGGNNLIGGTASDAGLELDGLQNNGGPTKTIALVNGPAVNAGNPTFDTSALTTDQRGTGYARLSGTFIDIGAFEAQAPTAISLTRDTVRENQPSGTFIGNFLTTDADLRDSFTYSLVKGTGSDDNALFTINAAGSLRTAATFDAATKSSYTIRVLTTDLAGLAFSQQFTITVLEATPPTIALVSPVLNQKVLIGDLDGTFINGTAADNVGVAAVKVRLSRKRNGVNQYWNGIDFVTTATTVDATVTPANGTSVTWNLDNVPPTNKLDAGTYQAEAYAQDSAGNKSGTVARPFQVAIDSIAPTIAISTPATNAVVPINAFNAGTITGTAGDDTGVSAVKIKLQRKRGSVTTYWNGTAFTTTPVLLDATVTTVGGTSVSWSYDTPIPANQLDLGGYTLYATAYDAAGNFKTSPSRLFTIIGASAGAASIASDGSASGS